MAQDDADFGEKLDLALKLLNISRAALASEARADKSLVSRWVRGITVPRGHNLAVLTAIIQRRVPGFTQLSWDLPLAALERALAGEIPPPAAASPAASSKALHGAAAESEQTGTIQSRPQSEQEVAREGHAYPAIYAAFRPAFRNSGEIMADLMILWRRGNRLFFRVFDPSFTHTGEAFILRHQMFMVGEDDQRVDGLIHYLLNGVSGQRAFRTDGVVTTVANDRHRTPTASPVVLQRLAELADEAALPDFDMLAGVSARMKAALAEGRIEAIAGPAVVVVIRRVIGLPQADGTIDHVTRLPMDRSLAASEIELDAALIADIARARAAFLPDPDAHPLPLGWAGNGAGAQP